MMSHNDWNSSTSGTVVAYFASGEDAQNAINELVDEGFPVSEIGAAFHGNSAPSATVSGSPSRPFHDEFPTMGSTASGAGVSGAESDTSGVTPAGLSTGSGTGFAGASRPGPIPGSEIPDNLPREIPSTLPSSSTAPQAEITDYPYSSSAFESSFTGMGISPDHSRRLAAEIRRGGAIVTVNAGPLSTAAEQIFERNHGRIRYESGIASGDAFPSVPDTARVHVFGRVQRVYPG